MMDETPLRQFWRNFRASRSAMAGLALVVLMMLAAVAAPWITPQDPYDLDQLDIMNGRLAPLSPGGDGTYFWLGTDDQGRDMLSGIIYGLRISMAVGIGSAVIAGLFGAAVGLVAAYVGGRTESALMRLVDLQLAFPSILMALMILALGNVLLAIVLVEWARYARTARGAALTERSREYVEAAECLALPRWRVVFRHILPNCLPPLVVLGTIQIARAITLEATLSFLGLGVPVTEPSLGLLIANGYQFMLSGQYWTTVFPGLALLLVVVGINLVGDQLRDVLDPRQAT